MSSAPPVIGYNLYVNPTYIVQLPEYDYSDFPPARSLGSTIQCQMCLLQVKNVFELSHTTLPHPLQVCSKCQAKFNLKHNQRKEELSLKADKRLKNAINWLVASAKNKRVYSKVDKKFHNFKVNFVTLTLPTTEHNISDKYFTGKMLKLLLNNLSYNCGLKNYIWRVEAQSNGNIHAHIITDCFIHHSTLRYLWNQILTKENLINHYQSKHSTLTISDYLNLYPVSEKHTLESRTRAFKYGSSTNWANPNSTDVHSIKNIDNIGSYVASYFTKKQEGKRELTCRLWACSESLSSSNKLTTFCENATSDEVLSTLYHPEIESRVIESKPDSMGNRKSLGIIYFIKPSFWGSLIKGKLLKLYNFHKAKIRNSTRDLFSDIAKVVERITDVPIPLVECKQIFTQTRLSF